MYHMKATHIELVPSVGYVHTTLYKYEDTWTSWVKVQSERHANRLIYLLNWFGTECSGPGGFYRRTYYDASTKRLVTNAGYDV